MEHDLLIQFIITLPAIIIAIIVGFFNFSFTRKQTTHQAHTDYEYEAKKNMYLYCEPILFQLSENIESALRVTENIAGLVKNNRLSPKGTTEPDDDYGLASTLYAMLLPLAGFRLFQNTITSIDLELEPHIKRQYQIAKLLYSTLSSDFALSLRNKNEDNPNELILRYYPTAESTISNSKTPAIQVRQGLYSGILDKITDKLIVLNNKNNKNIKIYSLMDFGEFREEYLKDDFSEIKKLFLDFHPTTKPILWRIIITQVYLYKALIDLYKGGRKSSNSELIIEINMKTRERRFDWRTDNEKMSPEEKIEHKSKLKKHIDKNCTALKKLKQKSIKIKNNDRRLQLYDDRIKQLESKIKIAEEKINEIDKDSISDEETLKYPFEAAKFFINKNKDRFNSSIISFKDDK